MVTNGHWAKFLDAIKPSCDKKLSKDTKASLYSGDQPLEELRDFFNSSKTCASSEVLGDVKASRAFSNISSYTNSNQRVPPAASGLNQNRTRFLQSGNWFLRLNRLEYLLVWFNLMRIEPQAEASMDPFFLCPGSNKEDSSLKNLQYLVFWYPKYLRGALWSSSMQYEKQGIVTQTGPCANHVVASSAPLFWSGHHAQRSSDLMETMASHVCQAALICYIPWLQNTKPTEKTRLRIFFSDGMGKLFLQHKVNKQVSD